MRNAALALIAALAFAPAALAQDPPAPAGGAPAPVPAKPDEKPAPAKPAAPAKHENKVTDAAKAFYETMSKKAYNPVNLGLKELKGTMEMSVTREGMEEQEGMPEIKVTFKIDFKAPRTITVSAETDNEMLAQFTDQFSDQVKQLFLVGMGTMEPDSSQEYDADVVVEKAGDKETKVLVVKLFQKGEAMGESRLTLDANGLLGKNTLTMMDPMSGMEQTLDMTFQFAKEGEVYRLEKQSLSHPMLPEPMETVISWADVGGFKVATGFTTQGAMGATMAYGYTELSVNGKKVELPKAVKKGDEKKVEEKKGDEKAGEAAEKKPEAPKEETPK